MKAMKRSIRTLIMLVASAALLIPSCTVKEDIEAINDEKDVSTFKFLITNSDNDAATKAVLGTAEGKKFLQWEDGDKIGTYVTGGSNSNNNPGTVNVAAGVYTLNFQTYTAQSVSNIYSYYPYSASAGSNKASAIITIPTTQYMTSDGFDADAMPMAGAPVSVTLSTTAANTDTPCGTINFSNLGSIIHFRVYSSVATSETLTSVKYITSDNKVAGDFNLNLTTVDPSNESTLALSGAGTSYEVTTIHNLHPTIGYGEENAIDVFMVVKPGSYTGSQVVVTTNNHTYTLDASNTKTYTRSHIKPMRVDIQNGTPGVLPAPLSWEKVITTSGFTAGTYYILDSSESYYLANTEAGSAPAVQTFTGNITDDMKWTATSSGSGLIFKNPNSELYLWGQDGTNDGVRVKASAPSASYAKVWVFSSNATLGLLASVGTTRYLSTYCKSGTQQDWRNYQSSNMGLGSTANHPAVFYKIASTSPSFSATGIDFGAVAATNTSTLSTANMTNVSYSVISAPAFVDSYEITDNTLSITTLNNYTTEAKSGDVVVRAIGDQGYLDAKAHLTQAASVFSASSTAAMTWAYNEVDSKSITITSTYELTQASNLTNTNTTAFTATLVRVGETNTYTLTVTPTGTNDDEGNNAATVTISRNGLNIAIAATQYENGGSGTATAQLTSSNMAGMSSAGTGYGTAKSITTGGYTWSTNGYQTKSGDDVIGMIQLRKRDHSSGISYIQLPTFPGNIQTITMKVSDTSATTYAGGSNPTATITVQSGTTNSETALVSGTPSSKSITLDLSAKNAKSGYIVLANSSGGCRIWDITVEYNTK